MTDSVTPIRKPRPGLGRGLSALLGDATGETPPGAASGEVIGVRMMAISALSPHPDQPRRRFDEEALEELARSVAERGVLLPLLVRPHGKDYQIVAGERRWRAAQRARLHEVPVIVREITDAETMELALARRAVEGRLSVREVERLAREAKPGAKGKGGSSTSARNADVEALERQLGDVLGLKVAIAHGDKGGTLTLAYSTLDQLDMLCQRLSGERI